MPNRTATKEKGTIETVHDGHRPTRAKTELTPIPEKELLNTSVPRKAATDGPQTHPQCRPTKGKQNPKSGKARSEGASTVCASQPKWKDWSSKNHVVITPPAWEYENATNLMGGLKYPRYIQGENIIELLQKLLRTDDEKGEELFDFTAWKKSLKPEELNDEDKYEVQLWLSTLASSWKCSHRHRQNESEYRRGFDNMIELAFSFHNGAKHKWHAEQYLALPGKPNKAKVDAMTTLAMPKFWKDIVTKLENSYLFSWSYYAIAVSIITFVIEYKRLNAAPGDERTALNQMIMDTHCALMQRRALGFEGLVFGATLAKDELRFYESFLKGELRIVRAILQPFKVRKFVEFFKVYFVLCRIAEYQAEQFEKQVERWDQNRKNFREWLKKPFSPDDEDNARKPWRDKKRDDSEEDGGSGGATENTVANESEAKGGTDIATPEPADEVDAKDVQHGDVPSKDVSSLTKEHLGAHDALYGLKDCSSVLNSTHILTWASEVDKCRADFENYSSRIWGYVHEEADPDEQHEFIASEFVSDALDSGELFIIDHDMQGEYLFKDLELDSSGNSTTRKATKSVSNTLIELFMGLEVSEPDQRADKTGASDTGTFSGNGKEGPEDPKDPPFAQVSEGVRQPPLGPTKPGNKDPCGKRFSYAEVLKKAPPAVIQSAPIHAPGTSKISGCKSYAAAVKSVQPARNRARNGAAVHGPAPNNASRHNTFACGHAQEKIKNAHANVGNLHPPVSRGARPLEHQYCM